jgi:hypothetical protein
MEAWQVPKFVAVDFAETVFELLSMDVLVSVELVDMAAGWSCDIWWKQVAFWGLREGVDSFVLYGFFVDGLLPYFLEAGTGVTGPQSKKHEETKTKDLDKETLFKRVTVQREIKQMLNHTTMGME